MPVTTDARTIKPIMEWKAETAVASCFAQFSFDETSILDVSANGSVSKMPAKRVMFSSKQ
jgi:hypothetical protein